MSNETTVKVLVTTDTLMTKTKWLRTNASGQYTGARVEKEGPGPSYLVVDFTNPDTAVLFKLSV